VTSGRLGRPTFGSAAFAALSWRPRIPPSLLVTGLIVTLIALSTAFSMLDRVLPLGHGRAGHAEIATFAGLAAILGALLLMDRFRHDGELTLALASASLLVLGVANLGLAVPLSKPTTVFLTWLALVIGVAGRLLFAAAALVPARRVERRLALVVRVCAGLAAGVLLVAMGLAISRAMLPVPRQLDPLGRVSEEHLSIPGAFYALQAVSSAALGLAAFGFHRRARGSGDELMLWLAGAGLVGSVPHAAYFVLPSDFADWVYIGDGRVSVFFGIALVGAVRDFAARQVRLKADEAAAERQRLARDLHDGIAQELAFIATQARLAQHVSGEQWIADITNAADRALAESRGALRVLTNSSTSPAEILVAAAEDVAQRAGAGVRFECDDDLSELSSAETRDALVRIVREAVTNAVRHGQATMVTLRLHYGKDGLRLTIADDGIGFDPSGVTTHESGLGLASMTARAVALGGRLHVDSQPGAGTSVELALP
jgi:signal transduction histidine kinase